MNDATERFGIGELAGSAGVSVQHCRDLESSGVLPPAERTPGGHRRFSVAHLLALRAHEALAAGHGFGRAASILVRVNRGEIDEALETLDLRHATIHRQRAQTRTVLAMLRDPDGAHEHVRLPDAASVGAAARELGVSTSTLRHWENEGLVRPSRDSRNGYRRFSRTDLRQVLVVRMLRDAGYPIEQIRGVVALLARAHPQQAAKAAERRLEELADASRAALAGDAELWRYLEATGPVEVRPVRTHVLYG